MNNKIAIFWEERFDNNKFLDLNLDKNLSPFLEFAEINKRENTISYDLLSQRTDKDDFIIFCFLTFSLHNIKRYIEMLWKYRKNKKILFLFEPKVVAPVSYWKLVHLFFTYIYTWDDGLVNRKKYHKFIWPQS